MKFAFDLTLGDRKIRIEDEAATPAEVFKKIAFWDSLPKAGPGGETDLEFSYRTPKGFEFFAIVCESAEQEFKFGQLKDNKGIFPKGWSPLQRGADEYDEEEVEQTASRAGARPQTDSAGDLKASASVDLDRLAARLAGEGRVSKTEAGYAVAPNDKIAYTVERSASGKVICNCERFDKGVANDPAYRCEHILAVKLFARPRAA